MQDYAPKVFYSFIPSKSGVKKAIKKGLFLLNGEIAQTGTWINSGQTIELVEGPFQLKKVYEFRLEIIFEDEHFAIINKPAGISVSGNLLKTVANALTYNLTQSSEKDALTTPTPVHRLDNQTSGLLLIAKTKTAQIELGKQFKNQSIQKKYCAVVIGEVHNNTVINSPIDNKTAETSFEIIRVTNSLKFNKLTCLKVSPKTGRTHQIRIHLSSIGHPILGDKLYSGNQTFHKGKGLFLCATEITFMHPKTAKTLTLKLNIPHKFKSLIVREKRRWNTYNH